jgi:hypothetical protein
MGGRSVHEFYPLCIVSAVVAHKKIYPVNKLFILDYCMSCSLLTFICYSFLFLYLGFLSHPIFPYRNFHTILHVFLFVNSSCLCWVSFIIVVACTNGLDTKKGKKKKDGGKLFIPSCYVLYILLYRVREILQ